MSDGLGNLDDETHLDVPTMMRLLTIIYNTMRDDDVMQEAAEAVGDAVCLLGDMRRVAQQVVLEDAESHIEMPAEFIRAFQSADPRKVC